MIREPSRGRKTRSIAAEIDRTRRRVRVLSKDTALNEVEFTLAALKEIDALMVRRCIVDEVGTDVNS